MSKKTELLAPVGSMQALYAAVANGADAVYLGGKLFNARQYASNFDREEIKKAVKYAHIRDVKVYVTLNILLDNNELKDAMNYIFFLYSIDVDAVIVQDLGLVELIRESLPSFEIHASTQMSINNYMGVKFAEEIGLKRVVLAREMSYDEIKFIHGNTDIGLEGFIHGALCICYSGQCLMSSLIGGRSGNRGKCAQPCRMKYSLVKVKDDKIIDKAYKDKYILSPKDLNTIDYLSNITNSGIESLKIEGRMKRPEYVAIIVQMYRKALDKIVGYNTDEITKIDKKKMKQIFNRGFTKGYIMNEKGKNLISFNRSNNKGVFIGNILDIGKKYMSIKLIDDLRKGDGIQIVDKTNNKGFIINELYYNGKLLEHVKRGEIAQVKLLKGIKKGAKVMKTSDKILIDEARRTFESENDKKISIYMAVNISIGENIKLYLWDDDNNYVNVYSKESVERGIKISLTNGVVKKQLEKLGNTPYNLKNIEIDLEEGAMVSYSILNKLRRKAVEILSEKRSCMNNNRKVITKEKSSKVDELLSFSKRNRPFFYNISIKIDNYEQFKCLDLKKINRIYLNFKKNLLKCIYECQEYNFEVFLSTPKIIENDILKFYDNIINEVGINKLDGISVSNLGMLRYIYRKYDINIHCDIEINIFNNRTIEFLKKFNVSSISLSPELTLNQIHEICKNTEVPCEVIGYGFLPVMITKYCPLSMIKKCNIDGECKNCKFAQGYGLKDRKNEIFEIVRKDNTTLIYNSHPLMVVDFLSNIYNKGVHSVRLDFTIEKNDIKEIQNVYYDYANGIINKATVKKFVDNYKNKSNITKGHFFRGVL